MGISKTKIVLDADVIIHFSKGGLLHLLPKILPEFQFIVLDIVKNELPASISAEVDNQIRWLHNISEEIFGNTYEERREFARLTSTTGMALGRGESACMVYCLYNHDVVGSSNTRDVATYCDEHNIIYLTTNDFLFYGICRGVITKKRCFRICFNCQGKRKFPSHRGFRHIYLHKDLIIINNVKTNTIH